jgi:drug/metabolite transporter (DMT)-like permease
VTFAPAAPVARRRLADLALVATAFFFGTTFVVVQDAVEEADVLPFLAVRFLIAAALLAPIARRRPGRPGEWRAGAVAGGALLVGYVFQTAGLQYTTSSVSAFITYLLVVFVPILSALVLRRPPTVQTVIGIAVAVVGLFLLTGASGVGFGRGEALTVGCALAFAAHILVLAEVAPTHDPFRLTAVQVVVVGGACLLPGLLTGGYGFPAEAWLAAAYTGVAATAVAFCLQTWAQRVVGPSRTALVLLLEPVFAAGLGYAVGDRLGIGGVVGATLILAAVVMTELPSLTSRSSSREPGPSPRPST